MRWSWPPFLLGLPLVWDLPPALGLHYGAPPCGIDEVEAEVLGAMGHVCAPRCEESTFSCAGDPPQGAAARPQCMLKDSEAGAFCGLLCQMDAQCPGGATCRMLKQASIGMCLYPVAFADWARSSPAKKLSIGWPSHPSAQGLAAEVTRTAQALQSLKQKFGIGDGDQDMATLQGYVASLSPGGAMPGVQPAPAGLVQAVQVGGIPALPPAVSPSAMQLQPAMQQLFLPSQQVQLPQQPLPAPVVQPGLPQPGAQPGQHHSQSSVRHDVNYFVNNLEHGLPGIEREIHDTVWNLEHIEERGVATTLVRGLILLGLVYLGVGAAVMSLVYGARGIDVVPNIAFWREYPKLVTDGVQYAKILVGAGTPKFGGDGLSGGISAGVPASGLSRDFGGFEQL